jgi:hypothetical protein
MGIWGVGSAGAGVGGDVSDWGVGGCGGGGGSMQAAHTPPRFRPQAGAQAPGQAAVAPPARPHQPTCLRGGVCGAKVVGAHGLLDGADWRRERAGASGSEGAQR